MKLISSVLFITLNTILLFSQPKQEVRAVWLTTNLQLDWPPRTLDQEIQKKALVDILDDLRQKNFNTIYFQVRSQGSVMFKSLLEPWSQYLTGMLGGEPDYDPLKFILGEARKRNFELHAWVNMIRCKIGEQYPQTSNPPHIMNRNPDWVKRYTEGNSVSYWLDPGLPEVREYLKNICVELTANYDIDGIHFDFIRYPGNNFDDSYSYSIFGNGMNLSDWRRENINTLVSGIYDTLISIKPMLKVGSAPIGIYENLPGARGWEGRNSVFQDSREWLRRGKQDYLVPQIYWDLENNPRFDLLINDWVTNNNGRQIIAGIGAYERNVFQQLDKLISVSRAYNSNGQSFFRYENISKKKFDGYSTLSNIPPMKWKDNIPPNAPYELSAKNLSDRLGLIELVWGLPLPAVDGDTAKYYNIYKSEDKFIDRNNSKYLSNFSNGYYFYDNLNRPSQLEYYYQVGALDKGNNESLDATGIIKVELLNLKNVLRHVLPVSVSFLQPRNINDKIFFSVDLVKSGSLKIDLKSESEKLLKSIFDGYAKIGQNIFYIDTKDLKSQKVKLGIKSGEYSEEIVFSLR
ncbi:MAG: family 10 glycosylhydrolase [Bacteroidetes bacterium]|nr:family 10 glycosylhydrolase [Bacteroidota bacterium]